MSKFGIHFKLARYIDGATWQNLGGIIRTCRGQRMARELAEPGVGQRQYVTMDFSEIRSRLEASLYVQRLKEYLKTFCWETGDLPIHDLYWSDGIENKRLDDAKVNSCSFSCRKGGLLEVDIVAIGKTIGAGASFTQPTYPEKAISFKNISITLAGASITNWESIGWGIDHHLSEESWGTDPETADVQEGEYECSVELVVSRKVSSKLGDVGTLVACEIAVVDNQSPAVTTTYTFSDCALRLSRLEVPGLGALLERIELKPLSVSIS